MDVQVQGGRGCRVVVTVSMVGRLVILLSCSIICEINGIVLMLELDNVSCCLRLIAAASYSSITNGISSWQNLQEKWMNSLTTCKPSKQYSRSG